MLTILSKLDLLKYELCILCCCKKGENILYICEKLEGKINDIQLYRNMCGTKQCMIMIFRLST